MKDSLDITKEFDFQLWSELAQKDGAAFEEMRQEAIKQTIESLSSEKDQHRLRQLQWRIDQECRLTKSPLDACVRVSSMMWETLMGEGGLLHHLNMLTDGTYEDPAATTPPADVLQFAPQSE